MDEGMNEYPWCHVLKISPFIKKDDIEEIKEINGWDLLVIFKDGRKIIVETDSGYHRSLFYNDINELSEEQEKKEFGYALRTMMKRKYMNQEDLAEFVGTSQTMISHYMSGRCLPNIIMGRKLAKALGCSMDELFYIDYSKYLE